jgi:cytochrome oxidase assembly protein ShyY1
VLLLQRRWVVGHALVVILASAFLALGFWQLARDRQKQEKVRANNAAFAAPAPLVTTLNAKDVGIKARAQASGTYDVAHQVLLRNQTRGDRVGDDLLTPLRLSDGTAVLVDRGWIPSPSSASGRGRGSTSTVTVRGLARAARSLSAQDAPRTEAGLLSLARVDLGRVQQQVPYRVRDVWIEAQSQSPAPGAGDPQLPQPPSPDPVNHMEYAIEWFAFAALPLIGWPIVCSRILRRDQPKPPARTLTATPSTGDARPA